MVVPNAYGRTSGNGIAVSLWLGTAVGQAHVLLNIAHV